MNKKSISINLIHNNDQARLSYIRPNILALGDVLKDKFDVYSGEISYQPSIVPVSTRLAVYRDFLYWELNRKWLRYRKLKRQLLVVDFAKFCLKSVLKYVINIKEAKKWRRNCAIEIAVTNKHILSLQYSLNIKSDYLLVFEDDAVFLSDSITNISRLMDKLDGFDEQSMYIDLAGGCSPEVLKIDKLEISKDSDFRYYAKPVTNTACCYLVNKKQLQIFNDFIINKPKYRYVGIDWMFNQLFIESEKRKIYSKCCHADLPIFKHGSVTGQYSAWIR